MRGLRLWLWMFALGCGAEPGALEGVAGAGGPIPDLDSDGLCDSSEADLGTDNTLLDTDADGLPDLLEVVYGYDPIDPDSPSPSALALLQARPGAELDFQVRTTVDGGGEGHSGAFEPLSSFYEAEDASRFFHSANATGAEPPDNVRGALGDTERFDSILGETRLSFNLRFRYPPSSPAPQQLDCTKALPFRYVTKADGGGGRTEQYFLLLVGSDSDAESFCLPSSCL